MRLDVTQRKVGEVEQEWIDNLLEFLDQNEEDWFVDNYRKAAGGMYHCHSIPLRHSWQCILPATDIGSDTTDLDQIKSITNRVLYDKYESYLQPFIDRLQEIYPKSTDMASFISRLAPGKDIGGHTDNSLFGMGCHRVHIPLRTSPEVEYIIADDPCHNPKLPEDECPECYGKTPLSSFYWEAGNVYEFSQDRWHMVHNGSDDYRIHLVINVYNYTDEFWENYNNATRKEKRIINDEWQEYYRNKSNGVDII